MGDPHTHAAGELAELVHRIEKARHAFEMLRHWLPVPSRPLAVIAWAETFVREGGGIFSFDLAALSVPAAQPEPAEVVRCPECRQEGLRSLLVATCDAPKTCPCAAQPEPEPRIAYYVVEDEGNGALAYWGFATRDEAEAYRVSCGDFAQTIALPAARVEAPEPPHDEWCWVACPHPVPPAREPEPHKCDNCEGIDPGTCFFNPALDEVREAAAARVEDSRPEPSTHETRVAWCGVPSGDGYRAQCSCGWMGRPTPISAVARVDCDEHIAAAGAAEETPE